MSAKSNEIVSQRRKPVFSIGSHECAPLKWKVIRCGKTPKSGCRKCSGQAFLLDRPGPRAKHGAQFDLIILKSSFSLLSLPRDQRNHLHPHRSCLSMHGSKSSLVGLLHKMAPSFCSLFAGRQRSTGTIQKTGRKHRRRTVSDSQRWCQRIQKISFRLHHAR